MTERCTDCGGDADRGWTDGELHAACAPCEAASALADFQYTTTPGDRSAAWGEDGKRTYHRAYMQDWRNKRKLAVIRQIREARRV